MTVYATRSGTGVAQPGEPDPGPTPQAIDISVLAKPTLIASWDLAQEPGMPRSGMHDLDVNASGTRGYKAYYGAHYLGLVPERQGGLRVILYPLPPGHGAHLVQQPVQRVGGRVCSAPAFLRAVRHAPWVADIQIST